ncbi:MAG: MBL fold metallo-hydrolase [bacterium]|nr:MBL fold metallo-hydrolase [bacterium]
MKIETLDLRFQGSEHVIAAFLVHGPESPVLIETGPGSTLPTLIAELDRRGIRPADVRDVLVTHIHLDHAGCAGWWAREGARVHVHPIGAPHLIDPSKLLASATRIYGDRMQTLWGEILAAPADRVVVVEDGATIEAGGLKFRVVETPGHAWHHHVFCIDDVAFTGDAAGIQLPQHAWIDLPAPPPEFDREAWRTTLSRLRELDLRTLYRTHFGPGADAAAELDRFEETMEVAVDWIRDMFERGLEREAMIAEFSRRMRERASAAIDDGDARAYELANPRSMSVDGISRYWRKKNAS